MKISKYLIPGNYSWYVRRKFLNFLYPQDKIKILHTNYSGVGILIRANEDVGKSIIAKRFEFKELQYIKSQMSENAIFIDIGSNVGLFSLVVASGSASIQVHAFDPLTLNNNLLASSAKINGLENIIINESCIGNYDGVVQFSVATDSAYSSIRDSGRKTELKKITLPIIKLDTYANKIKLQKIDFIKIDVEGAEKMVIEGANQIFKNSKLRPKMMMIELCDKNLRAFETSVKEMVLVLERLGYKAFVLANNYLIEFKYQTHANTFENIFFRDETAI